ncbi:hypothetical protein LG943_23715 [Streptomonospora sp. S1-112]|uniref:Uncharacterized protein n=1 Tax=Streptomonospora mangrovi TaxID=2883123 RepID=A0A9X3NS07_9ACTN|nr:hypothetical protein [Streptomonospora mangrovi]MDA0567303.1 hypothetical protein [Streptomonospora mangrovi]
MSTSRLWRAVALIAGLAIFGLVGALMLPSLGENCGDYDRADAEDVLVDRSRIERGIDGFSYEYEPGEGDYRKTGPGEFEFVGCADGSRHGGGGSTGTVGYGTTTGTSGGSSGSTDSYDAQDTGGYGSTTRGGGPGFGK